LNIKKWKKFRMDELFIFKKGKRLIKEDMIEGNTNFIASISDNNGIRNKIDLTPNYENNCITVNYNGSVGEAFYQKKSFCASDDVNVLYPKSWELNRNIGLFLVTVIKFNKYRFGYGRKWTLEKMKETKIALPCNKYKNPDWTFMNNYIQSLNSEPIRTSIHNKTFPIFTKNWKSFKLNNLFEIQIATSENFGNLGKGNIPFIGRSEINNGFQGYVDTKKINKGKCLTISMVGTIFATWQDKNFSASQNILILCNTYLNKLNGLFIATILNYMLKYKHNYNRPIQKNKFLQEFIKLPATKKGNPDWQFMENYIKSLPYSDKIL
ncbi:MAG: restriction endonuclease subunit S, partial [Endomicrobiia bacterium]